MIFLSEEHNKALISQHFSKGNVLLWKNFHFENGNVKDSRFLLLTDCKSGKFLAVRPTTKLHFYEKGNIHREWVRVSVGQEAVLPDECIIDLNSIRLFKVDDLKKILGLEVSRSASISSTLLKLIDERVSKSKILRRDWIRWILTSLPSTTF